MPLIKNRNLLLLCIHCTKIEKNCVTILDYKSLVFIPFTNSYLIATVTEGHQILLKYAKRITAWLLRRSGSKSFKNFLKSYTAPWKLIIHYGNDRFTLPRSLIYARFPYIPNVLINELINSSNYFINVHFVKYISGWFNFRVELLTTILIVPVIKF